MFELYNKLRGVKSLVGSSSAPAKAPLHLLISNALDKHWKNEKTKNE